MTEKLIQMLKAIEIDDEITPQRYLSDQPSNAIDDVQLEASAALITNNGHCNHHNMRILKDAGFSVTPGEQDSFGWLTGCIHTKKGIIVYG